MPAHTIILKGAHSYMTFKSTLTGIGYAKNP